MAVRTLADYIAGRTKAELEEAGDPIARRLIEQNGAQYFRCRCDRVVTTDTMVDLEPPGVTAARVPTTIRAYAIRKRAAVDDRRFACDGCWTSWVRAGRIERNSFRRAIGAPELPANSTKPW